MGGQESKNDDLKEIGQKANKQSPNSFINSSVIKLSNQTILEIKDINPEQDYRKLKMISEGQNSSVYEVQNRVTDIIRSMKIIKKNPGSSKQDEKDIIDQINILKKIDHPNIVKMFEFYNYQDYYSIIAEFCKGGQFYEEIRAKAPFDEKYTAYVMYQIFSAINYCHKLNIIHRDLKPENIFIVNRYKNNYYPNIKIADFGMGTMIEKNKFQNKLVGSIHYVAPEVIEKRYNEKCDIWSCGVIMYALLSRNPPFGGDTEEEIIYKIKKGNYDLKSHPFDKISESGKDLIRKLLTKDIKQRISAQDALNHPWFKEQKSKELYNEIQDEKIVEKLLNNLKKYKKNSIIQETSLAFLVHNFPQMKDVINACKLFNQLDLNGDGKITEHELYKFLCHRINSDTLDDDIREIYNKLDMDNDGYIQYEEFVRAAVSKEKFLGENVLKFAFGFFDKDNSGKITFNEIAEVYEKSIPDKKNVEKALNNIMNEVDINRDGKISFDEFSKVMKKMLE